VCIPSHSYPSGSAPSPHHPQVLFFIIIVTITIIISITPTVTWWLDGDDASSSPKTFPESTCSKSSNGTAQQLKGQGVDPL
jgi:hypothetical protein